MALRRGVAGAVWLYCAFAVDAGTRRAFLRDGARLPDCLVIRAHSVDTQAVGALENRVAITRFADRDVLLTDSSSEQLGAVVPASQSA